MTRKLLVGAIAAGAFAITAGTAFALTGDDSTSTPGAAAATSITSDDNPTSSGDTQTSGTQTTTIPTSGTPTSGTPIDGTAAPATTLTADDARRIVQARYGGTVDEVERESEHGRLEWEVEIDAADGHRYEVHIDAQSGAVTRVEQDDDHDRGRHGDDRHDDDRHGDDD